MELANSMEKTLPMGDSRGRDGGVQPGCVGILGASGCGKSMMLKSIAGIVTPEEGRICLNGRVLYDSEAGTNLSARKRRVGYLFQDYALFPNMTVEENIAIGLKTRIYRKRSISCTFSIRSFSAGRTGKAVSGPSVRRTEAKGGFCAYFML